MNWIDTTFPREFGHLYEYYRNSLEKVYVMDAELLGYELVYVAYPSAIDRVVRRYNYTYICTHGQVHE